MANGFSPRGLAETFTPRAPQTLNPLALFMQALQADPAGAGIASPTAGLAGLIRMGKPHVFTAGKFGTIFGRFPLHDEGKFAGEVLVSRFPGSSKLSLENIFVGEGSRGVNLDTFRRMLQQILDVPEFKGVTRIGGTRISGMAGETAKKAAAEVGRTALFPSIEISISRFLKSLKGGS